MKKAFLSFSTFCISAFCLFILSACKPANDTSSTTTKQNAANPPANTRPKYLTEEAESQMLAAGIQLDILKQGKRHYNLYCTACHLADISNASSEPTNMLAPPSFAVAHHYQVRHQELEQRIHAIQKYVSNPTEADALMPGAISRFGPMIKINLPEEQVQAIAVYLSLAKFDKPSWYQSHYQQMHGEMP